MKKIKKFFMELILSFYIIFSLIIYSCGNEKNDSENLNTAAPVTITHPFKTSLSDYIVLNGTTVFLTKEIVRGTFQGFIENVYKNIGDPVVPGEDLFQIKTMESGAADSLSIYLGNRIFKGYKKLTAHSKGVLTE